MDTSKTQKYRNDMGHLQPNYVRLETFRRPRAFGGFSPYVVRKYQHTVIWF